MKGTKVTKSGTRRIKISRVRRDGKSMYRNKFKYAKYYVMILSKSYVLE
jgi:hypothetical protein